MKLISSFPERLKEYMKAHGNMTYDELSKITGYPPQTLNRYALGQRTPKIDDFANIATSIGVDPLWLQGFDQGDKSGAQIDIDAILRNSSGGGVVVMLGGNGPETIPVTPQQTELVKAIWAASDKFKDDSTK